MATDRKKSATRPPPPVRPAKAGSAAARKGARAAATPLRPSATGTTAITAASVGVTALPALPLQPPLERALGSLTRELRKLFDQTRAEIAALRTQLDAARAELAQLRERYDGHTHVYQVPQWGGGGHQWIELRFLQGYLDGKYPGHATYGFWAHGQSQSNTPPDHDTSGPSH